MNWIIEAFLKIMPAYFGNSAPVFLAKILKKTHPIDGGIKLRDRKRLLGDGKSWEGIFASMLGGALGGAFSGLFGLGDPFSGLIIGFAAILGDMAGSFTKRRLGFERGANAGLLDQMDFMVFALVASSLFMTWELRQIILLLLSTPFLHRLANIIGYRIKVKSVPW
jgi:CDP-2,3-bis-(O-geranylgeranyl)-sn-glycerol synthase